MSDEFEMRPVKVWAIDWLGTNFLEVEIFLRRRVGDPAQMDLGVSSDGHLGFVAYGKRFMVERGQWLVVPQPDALHELTEADMFGCELDEFHNLFRAPR